jgi:hypothetical protein
LFVRSCGAFLESSSTWTKKMEVGNDIIVIIMSLEHDKLIRSLDSRLGEFTPSYILHTHCVRDLFIGGGVIYLAKEIIR